MRRAAAVRRTLSGALLLSLLLVPLAGAQRASAQSLLGAGGLGFPVEPVDARARGMGSLGVGLFGPSLLPGDPAVAQALTVPMVTATYQPTWNSPTGLGGGAGDYTSSRFPLLGIAYPVGQTGGMATLTFSGFMDQRWLVESPGSVEFGGTRVSITDTFRSDGGVSVIRLGWAQALQDRLAAAVTVGSYLGDVRRIFTRSFDTADVSVPGAIESYQAGGRWRYSGPTVTGGVSWDPTDLIRVAGSVTWSGTLRAEASEDTEAGDREFDLPTRLQVGAAGSLAPRLTVNASLSYADWSDVGGGLGDSTSGPVWSMGGGVEWDGPRLGGRDLPVRLGYRRSDLPFRFGGEDPVESSWSLGLGLNLLQAEDLPLARIDLAVEQGDRSAGALSESFTRATVTLRVAGR